MDSKRSRITDRGTGRTRAKSKAKARGSGHEFNLIPKTEKWATSTTMSSLGYRRPTTVISIPRDRTMTRTLCTRWIGSKANPLLLSTDCHTVRLITGNHNHRSLHLFRLSTILPLPLLSTKTLEKLHPRLHKLVHPSHTHLSNSVNQSLLLPNL